MPTHKRRLWVAAVGFAVAALGAPPAATLAAADAAPSSAREARAAAVPFLTRTWTTDNGLPQNTVSALVQTQDGYLWLGTFGGLARFDGVRFTVFNTANTPALRSNRILALLEDRQGTLWIGTEEGGLTRLRNGAFTTFTTAQGLPHDMVHDLEEGRDGTLWVATHAGLARVDGDRVVKDDATAALPSPVVAAVREDPRGRLWVGTYGGLTRVRPGPVAVYTTANDLPSDTVMSLEPGPGDSLYVGTWGGLAELTEDRVMPVAGTERGPVWGLRTDPEGGVWVAAAGGAVLLRHGRATRYGASVLAGHALRSTLVDREGTLWMGTDGGGLTQCRPRVVDVYGAEQGLVGASARTIHEDAAGTLWIGTYCGGLHRLADGRLSFVTPRDGSVDACVASVHQDRAGRHWIGTTSGPYLFDAGRFVLYEKGLLQTRVNAIYEDRRGTLWVGTDGAGLARLAGDTFTSLGVRDGLAHDRVRFVTEDRAGALWIGTDGGLSRLENGRFTSYTTRDGLAHDQVRAVHEDQRGALWIGTDGGGLSRLKDGRFTSCTTRHGLLDDVVSCILDDGQGRLWLSGNRGIFRLSWRELDDFAEGRADRVAPVPFGTADGMRSAETNGGGQPAGWRARDGRLWFPTIAGAVAIDPERHVNRAPPTVLVEQLRIDGAERPAQPRIELPPGTHSLEIHYTATSLAAPEKVLFRYRLVGQDSGWVHAGSRRTAHYGRLAPGEYRFQVIARNNDGVWNTAGATLVLDQRPFFHQTGAFYLLCGLAVAASALAGYRLRVRRLIRRTLALEARVQERTAEVVAEKTKLALANAQLERSHDDLLATLNQLRLGVLLVDEDGAVGFLSRAARELVGCGTAEAAGRPWEEVLPVDERTRVELRGLMRSPGPSRRRLPARLSSGDGRAFWTEIDVEDDPRQAGRRMLFLYDVSEVYGLRRLLDDKAQFRGLVGESRAMQEVFQQAQELAGVDTTVLIEGETGTGKELVARAIHYSGPRRSKPFVAVNCAGLTESLLASQLFGHRRGAFTGAVADQVGFFEAADGGTLLLDEIGDVPASVQSSLLRVLQEREVVRLGETRPRRIDVRVIAATSRDLAQETADGRFRPDLLYRIRVARIQLPPLRDRCEDLPLLVAWLLGQARAATGKAVEDVSREAMALLAAHPWPGNVRELKGVIESALLRAKGPLIQPGDLPPEVLAAPPAGAVAGEPSTVSARAIQDAIDRAGGNRAAAARLLGISRSTLYRRLRELGLEPE